MGAVINYIRQLSNLKHHAWILSLELNMSATFDNNCFAIPDIGQLETVP
jgi:hypothetical protein